MNSAQRRSIRRRRASVTARRFAQGCIRELTGASLVALAASLLAIAPAQAAPGSLDPSFSDDGILLTGFGGESDGGSAVALQGDGKIVVAGSRQDGNFQNFGLARYTPTGSLDGSFGIGGRVSTPIGTASEVALTLVRQSDGKLVAAGYVDIGANVDFALARYNSLGSLDTTFGSGGTVITSITYRDTAYAVALSCVNTMLRSRRCSWRSCSAKSSLAGAAREISRWRR